MGGGVILKAQGGTRARTVSAALIPRSVRPFEFASFAETASEVKPDPRNPPHYRCTYLRLQQKVLLCCRTRENL